MIARDIEEVQVMESSASSKHADQNLQDPSDLVDLVRSAWRTTLASDPIDDDTGFFEAGGDSFLLFVLIKHLSKASGLALKAIDVIRADNVRGHAALIAQAVRDQRQESVNGA